MRATVRSILRKQGLLLLWGLGFHMACYCTRNWVSSFGFTALGAPTLIWEFPKIGGTLFWGPYNKDPTI